MKLAFFYKRFPVQRLARGLAYLHCRISKRSFSVYDWPCLPQEKNLNFDSVGNPILTKVSHLSFGHGTIVASTASRQSLLVSGVNSASQLGMPSSEIPYVCTVKEIKLPLTNNNSEILDLACGRLHTLVLTSEGLFVSGCNRLGQCGLGNIEETNQFTKISQPKQLSSVKQVVCGLDHSLLLMHDGHVWSCGWGADGQTGLCHSDEQTTFTQLEALKNVQIKKVVTKSDTSLALSNCGSVYAWGNSEYSQVGFATDKTLISKPTKILGLKNIVDIAIGGSVGIALTGEGEVYSWGYGYLGNTTDVCFSETPQRVAKIDEDVVKVDCGLDFYVLFTEARKMYNWGRLGWNTIVRTPKQISLPSRFVQTVCGVHKIGFLADE